MQVRCFVSLAGIGYLGVSRSYRQCILPFRVDAVVAVVLVPFSLYNGEEQPAGETLHDALGNMHFECRLGTATRLAHGQGQYFLSCGCRTSTRRYCAGMSVGFICTGTSPPRRRRRRVPRI